MKETSIWRFNGELTITLENNARKVVLIFHQYNKEDASSSRGVSKRGRLCPNLINYIIAECKYNVWKNANPIKLGTTQETSIRGELQWYTSKTENTEIEGSFYKRFKKTLSNSFGVFFFKISPESCYACSLLQLFWKGLSINLQF